MNPPEAGSMPTPSGVTDLAEEERIARPALDDDAFEALVARLNRQSVDKHFDAYADIAWDDPEYAVDVEDPRWAGAADGLFEAYPWWQQLPETTKARLGLHLIVTRMRTGMLFENILSRGLLTHAFALPSGHTEFRYLLHEVTEESHHSMMFQEFVNRTGLDAPKMPWDMRLASPHIVSLARRFPELFFVFVLGGEDPIDHSQRSALKNAADMHPLIERIMRIHVTEEARHLSFARHQLKRNCGNLSRVRRGVLSLAAPIVLSEMSKEMMGVPSYLVKKYDIPADVVAAVAADPALHAEKVAALSKVRRLLDDCGLITKRSQLLWDKLHLV